MSLDLNCLILGDDQTRVFTVEISNTKNVSFLKEEIKAKKEHTFRHVEAATLDLWKVSIPVDDLKKAAEDHCQDDNNEPLLPVKRLSGLFPKTLMEDHVHIVIRAPTPAQSPEGEVDHRLKLNCLVLGDGPGNIFPVQIGRQELVGDLKRVVKCQKEKAFQNVDADTLVLWKVSINAEEGQGLQENLDNLNFIDEGTLQPVEVLSEVFSDPPAQKHLHIVVQPPPGDLFSTRDAVAKNGDKSAEGTMQRLEEAHESTVRMAKLAMSPSSAARLPNLLNQQRKFPIWNGRPTDLSGLPIQLYHPVFSAFQEAIHSAEIVATADDYADAHTLLKLCPALYEDEASRELRIVPLLNKIHQIAWLRIVNGNNTKPDRGHVVPCGAILRALAGLMEIKNEIGTGGCDPAIQSGFSYREFWTDEERKDIRLSCCSPTLILAIAGPWMCVLGGVFTHSVYIQPLTNYINIGDGLDSVDKLRAVTRLFLGLRRGFSMLEQYYRDLPIRRSAERFFPYINSWTDENNNIVHFNYIGPLLDDHATRPIFLAERTQGQQIVVKFVQQYHPEAHRHLASLDLAPALLYFGSVAPATSHSGELFMVTMEFIRGKTAHDLYPTSQLPQAIYEQVKRAVDELHKVDLVFADLRKPNIMVTNTQHVKLIDFDWCGKDGEGRYPPTLNDNDDMKWHPDVERNGVLSREHDTFMLGKLLN